MMQESLVLTVLLRGPIRTRGLVLRDGSLKTIFIAKPFDLFVFKDGILSFFSSSIL